MMRFFTISLLKSRSLPNSDAKALRPKEWNVATVTCGAHLGSMSVQMSFPNATIAEDLVLSIVMLQQSVVDFPLPGLASKCRLSLVFFSASKITSCSADGG